MFEAPGIQGCRFGAFFIIEAFKRFYLQVKFIDVSGKLNVSFRVETFSIITVLAPHFSRAIKLAFSKESVALGMPVESLATAKNLLPPKSVTFFVAQLDKISNKGISFFIFIPIGFL